MKWISETLALIYHVILSTIKTSEIYLSLSWKNVLLVAVFITVIIIKAIKPFPYL